MTTTIRLFHNNNPHRLMDTPAYQSGDTVTEVLSYTARPDDGPHPAQFAFDLCNIGHDPDVFDPPDTRAVDYRERANRSLSVGDLVEVCEDDGPARWYAVARCGFDALDQAPTIENNELNGTTPIDAPLIQYGVTFTSPSELTDERWAIAAYAHNQLIRRIQRRLMTRLGVDHVRVRLGSEHTGLALSSGVEVAAFTAVPAPDATDGALHNAEADLPNQANNY